MTPAELRQARIALGLSRIRLGALAGISERTIDKAENGRAVGPAGRDALIRFLREAMAAPRAGDAPMAPAPGPRAAGDA